MLRIASHQAAMDLVPMRVYCRSSVSDHKKVQVQLPMANIEPPLRPRGIVALDWALDGAGADTTQTRRPSAANLWEQRDNAGARLRVCGSLSCRAAKADDGHSVWHLLSAAQVYPVATQPLQLLPRCCPTQAAKWSKRMHALRERRHRPLLAGIQAQGGIVGAENYAARQHIPADMQMFVWISTVMVIGHSGSLEEEEVAGASRELALHPATLRRGVKPHDDSRIAQYDDGDSTYPVSAQAWFLHAQM
ncbi:hypothetical protein WOLCODRAFT_164198 [Wolfiporia cocos MD-104 SS10]|uniref:Uncharacterized protein n=1 Tax=Wolfiporia cocos (strain MD-104) TaxID=742152 RepID=A0A2H3K3Q1_WOLCO|nr:hypothetical protein WOLCODRAFT_164198 [Wolfiporia cocos MD-104 SS10]